MGGAIRSPSFLKFVIDGKRNLTTPMIETFCQAMRLEPRDAKFFSTLVRFNQAKTAREKQDHYAVLCGPCTAICWSTPSARSTSWVSTSATSSAWTCSR